jgi:hypothetical protein
MKESSEFGAYALGIVGFAVLWAAGAVELGVRGGAMFALLAFGFVSGVMLNVLVVAHLRMTSAERRALGSEWRRSYPWIMLVSALIFHVYTFATGPIALAAGMLAATLAVGPIAALASRIKR